MKNWENMSKHKCYRLKFSGGAWGGGGKFFLPPQIAPPLQDGFNLRKQLMALRNFKK